MMRLPRMVGVVGAGRMGCGIAELFAQKGFPTVLTDVDEAILATGLERIKRSLRRSEGMTDAQKDESFGRISISTDLAKLSTAELIVEAVSEKEEVKTAVLRACSNYTQPQTLIATNTSSISITRLSAAVKHPDQFIGLHFMNPAPRMKLIEVVRGMQTSVDSYEKAKLIASSLGKITCTSNDRPGFIVNRILMPMINEAFFALMEGVSTAEEIDCGMKHGANHPMGPLELADFIGLDVCLSISTVLHDSLGEDKYRQALCIGHCQAHCLCLVGHVLSYVSMWMLDGLGGRQGGAYSLIDPRADILRDMDARFLSIERRLDLLETRFRTIKSKLDAGSPEIQSCPVESSPEKNGLITSHEKPSSTELLLLTELKALSFSFVRFVRVPQDYYDKDLEYRRQCLGASSCHQLCKTMVMENTKWIEHPSAMNVKYITVILQYEKDRVHGEKMRSFMHGLNEKSIPRKNFNLRLAPEEISSQLTGFGHNAVTPINSKTQMPIIISHEIANLEQGSFYIGAGEVNLKLELKTGEFIEKYKALVVDCTY